MGEAPALGFREPHYLTVKLREPKTENGEGEGIRITHETLRASRGFSRNMKLGGERCTGRWVVQRFAGSPSTCACGAFFLCVFVLVGYSQSGFTIRPLARGGTMGRAVSNNVVCG